MDKLIEKIKQKNNPTALGLDTSFEYLPKEMTKNISNLRDASKAIEEFNFNIIESTYNIIPAVKIQIAYYEMYGIDGLIAFKNTIDYANKKGLITILDVKRNDIGSTASCYAKAYLGSTSINSNKFNAFSGDYITVNGYLGEDGIKPFIDEIGSSDKGIFVLAKTSNPSSGQLQNLNTENGFSVYETMGNLIEEWGKGSIGKHGYSKVGAVVGATHPQEAQKLRKLLPHTMFLVPGYGAQGGTSKDLRVCFDDNKSGAIINNSRGLICAYKQEKFSGLSYYRAAQEAALLMQQDIDSVLSK